jgi:exodeoxyribonuclease-3
MPRIATFNVNGVNSRLQVLLQWLAESDCDVVCLQELKTSDEKFPASAIAEAGFHAVWHGQKSYNGVAILARGDAPLERRRGLPGDPDDTHSRYLEAGIGDLVIGCLYLPNGNPAPGPKFDYKMRWFDRLIAHAQTLLASGAPTVLCGDFNVVPSDIDAVVPGRWIWDAVTFPEARSAYARFAAGGLVRCPADDPPGKGHLYLLELRLSRRLRPQLRAAHGSLAHQPGAQANAQERGGGRRNPWLAEAKRPRAGLDRSWLVGLEVGFFPALLGGRSTVARNPSERARHAIGD